MLFLSLNGVYCRLITLNWLDNKDVFKLLAFDDGLCFHNSSFYQIAKASPLFTILLSKVFFFREQFSDRSTIRLQ
jgi:hypothetical protein